MYGVHAALPVWSPKSCMGAGHGSKWFLWRIKWVVGQVISVSVILSTDAHYMAVRE